MEYSLKKLEELSHCLHYASSDSFVTVAPINQGERVSWLFAQHVVIPNQSGKPKRPINISHIIYYFLHSLIFTSGLPPSFNTIMLARLSGLRSGFQVISASSLSRLFSTSRIHQANTLLFLEHKNGKINPSSLVALTAAGKLGGDVDGLVVGDDGIDKVVDQAVK